jgi:anti-anti-sigma factor
MMNQLPVAERKSAESCFTLEVEELAPGTLLLRLGGRLDASAADSLEDALSQRLVESRLRRIVVDLSEVALLAPSALRLFLRLRRRCRVEARHLVLVGVSQPTVNRPLRLSGLLPLFDIRPTVEAALRGPVSSPVDYSS